MDLVKFYKSMALYATIVTLPFMCLMLDNWAWNESSIVPGSGKHFIFIFGLIVLNVVLFIIPFAIVIECKPFEWFNILMKVKKENDQ